MLLAPFYASCLVALVVAAFAFARREPGPSRTLRPLLVWLGLLTAASVCLLLRFRGESAPLPSVELLGRAVGGGLLVLAAVLALRGSRVRLRADALRGRAPLSLDEAVAALRAGRAPGWGVYSGRLEVPEALTSPGGVPCAFYDAEVHAVGPGGRKGPLLSRERAYSPVLVLRGDKVRASVCFAPSALLAPVEVRRCLAAPVLAEAELLGEPPDALSWERVGAPGEPCLVVGELRRGLAEGAYELRGRDGRPALVVLGNEAPGTGVLLARRAWGHFAAAGALSLAAVLMLARAM